MTSEIYTNTVLFFRLQFYERHGSIRSGLYFMVPYPIRSQKAFTKLTGFYLCRSIEDQLCIARNYVDIDFLNSSSHSRYPYVVRAKGYQTHIIQQMQIITNQMSLLKILGAKIS